MLIRIRKVQYTPSVRLSQSLERFPFFPLVSVVLASFPGFLGSVGERRLVSSVESLLHRSFR